MRIDGAVVLVTAASSGTGASTARRPRAAGAELILQGRDPDRLAAIAAETGATAVPGDLSDPAGVRAVARRAVEVSRSSRRTRAGPGPHAGQQLAGQLDGERVGSPRPRA